MLLERNKREQCRENDKGKATKGQPVKGKKKARSPKHYTSTPKDRQESSKTKERKAKPTRRRLVYSSESSEPSGGSPSSSPEDSSDSSSSSNTSSSSDSGERRRRRKKKKGYKRSTRKKHKRKKRKAKSRSPITGWTRRRRDHETSLMYQSEEGREFYRRLPAPWNKLPRGPPVSLSQLNVIQKFMTKHDGTVAGHQIFRASFLISVHQADIAILAKFMMMRHAVEGVSELSGFLQTLPPGAEGYKALIVRLEEKFGGLDNLLNYHLAKIKKVPLVMPNKIAEAEALVDAVSAYQTALDHAGEDDADSHAHFIMVKNKLCHELKQRYWQDCQGSKSKKRKYNQVSNLLKWIKRHVIAPLRLDPVPKARDPPAGVNRGGEGRQAAQTPEAHKREAKWQQRQGQLFVTNAPDSDNCPLCQQKHLITKCPTFLGFTVSERRDKVRELRLCYKCFSRGHGVRTCKAYSCKICKRSHHIMLHDNDYTYKPNNDYNRRRVSFRDGGPWPLDLMNKKATEGITHASPLVIIWRKP